MLAAARSARGTSAARLLDARTAEAAILARLAAEARAAANGPIGDTPCSQGHPMQSWIPHAIGRSRGTPMRSGDPHAIPRHRGPPIARGHAAEGWGRRGKRTKRTPKKAGADRPRWGRRRLSRSRRRCRSRSTRRPGLAATTMIDVASPAATRSAIPAVLLPPRAMGRRSAPGSAGGGAGLRAYDLLPDAVAQSLSNGQRSVLAVEPGDEGLGGGDVGGQRLASLARREGTHSGRIFDGPFSRGWRCGRANSRLLPRRPSVTDMTGMCTPSRDAVWRLVPVFADPEGEPVVGPPVHPLAATVVQRAFDGENGADGPANRPQTPKRSPCIARARFRPPPSPGTNRTPDALLAR